MTTAPRRKDETPAERGLRLAQAVFDRLPSDVKASMTRPGSLKHGHMFVRSSRKRGGGQAWAHRAMPKGFEL